MKQKNRFSRNLKMVNWNVNFCFVTIGLSLSFGQPAFAAAKAKKNFCLKLFNSQTLQAKEASDLILPQTPGSALISAVSVDVNPGSARFNVSSQLTDSALHAFIIPSAAIELNRTSASGRQTQTSQLTLQIDPTRIQPATESRAMIGSSTSLPRIAGASSRGQVLLVTTPSRSPEELLEAAVALYKKDYAQDEKNEETLRRQAAILLKGGFFTPEKIQRAIDGGEIQLVRKSGPFSSRGRTTLSNQGLEQYFWVRLKNSGEPKPARILDLHEMGLRNSPIRPLEEYPKGFTILAEVYLNYDAETGIYENKEIHLLQKDDVKGLLTDIELVGEASRESARLVFDSELTLEQIRVAELAKKMNLEIYSYNNPFNQGGSSIHAGHQNAHYMMTNDIAESVFAFKLKEILSDEKKSTLQKIEETFQRQSRFPQYRTFNIIDFFSGLHPKNLFREWFSEDLIAGKNIEFAWVITTDGSLRISPQADIGITLKAQTLRVAQGRRIFAGGKFFMKPDGSLSLTLDSVNYEAQLIQGWGVSNSSFGGSEDLENFVDAVFREVAGKKVSEMQNRPVRVASGASGNWILSSADYDPSNFSTRTYFDPSSVSWTGLGSQGQFEARPKAGKPVPKASAKSEKSSVDWSAQNPPLSVEAYAKQFNRTSNSEETRLNYGLYILGVRDNTPFKEIVKAKQQLVKNLGGVDAITLASHPNHEIIKIVNNSFSFLKDYFKSRGVLR